MNINIDPSEDREEFIYRLHKIFDPMKGIDQKECLMRCAIMNDQEYIAHMQQRITEMETRMKNYIEAYDAAQTKEARQLIVSQIHR